MGEGCGRVCGYGGGGDWIPVQRPKGLFRNEESQVRATSPHGLVHAATSTSASLSLSPPFVLYHTLVDAFICRSLCVTPAKPSCTRVGASGRDAAHRKPTGAGRMNRRLEPGGCIMPTNNRRDLAPGASCSLLSPSRPTGSSRWSDLAARAAPPSKATPPALHAR